MDVPEGRKTWVTMSHTKQCLSCMASVVSGLMCNMLYASGLGSKLRRASFLTVGWKKRAVVIWTDVW